MTARRGHDLARNRRRPKSPGFPDTPGNALAVGVSRESRQANRSLTGFILTDKSNLREFTVNPSYASRLCKWHQATVRRARCSRASSMCDRRYPSIRWSGRELPELSESDHAAIHSRLVH